MDQLECSPRIVDFAWGQMEVEGHGRFKDAVLFPGGARAWDWRETGTDHESGIQPADVEELLAHGARAVVIARGMVERLSVAPETLRLLEERGIATYVLQTEEAVRTYNELRERELVGGLFHTTC